MDCHSDQSLQEKLAEELRLLYVALTRARYQLNIVFPSHFTTKRLESTGVFAICDRDRNRTFNTNQLEYRQRSRVPAMFNARRISAYGVESQAHDWRAAQSQQLQLQAAEFNGRIENNWRISSFTALAAMNSRNQQRSQQRSQKRQKNALKNIETTLWTSSKK